MTWLTSGWWIMHFGPAGVDSRPKLSIIFEWKSSNNFLRLITRRYEEATAQHNMHLCTFLYQKHTCMDVLLLVVIFSSPFIPFQNFSWLNIFIEWLKIEIVRPKMVDRYLDGRLQSRLCKEKIYIWAEILIVKSVNYLSDYTHFCMSVVEFP